jgi:hypothetical protein
VNGTWLLDASNNKIPVTGPKGDTGPTPVIGIDAGGFWTVDVGDGIPIQILDASNQPVKAKGEDGANGAFSGVDASNPDHVTITLSNGTTIELPKYQQLGISFDVDTLEMKVNYLHIINYTLTGADQYTRVRAIEQDSLRIVVKPTDISHGTIEIATPGLLPIRSEILFLLSNGDGATYLSSIMHLAQKPNEPIVVGGNKWAWGNLVKVGSEYKFYDWQAECSGKADGGDYWNSNTLDPLDYTVTNIVWSESQDPCRQVDASWHTPTITQLEALVNSGYTYGRYSLNGENSDFAPHWGAISYNFGVWFGTTDLNVAQQNPHDYVFLPVTNYRNNSLIATWSINLTSYRLEMALSYYRSKSSYPGSSSTYMLNVYMRFVNSYLYSSDSYVRTYEGIAAYYGAAIRCVQD